MLNKNCLKLLLLVTTSLVATVSKAELATLFTTAQERQIININRYKTAEVKLPNRTNSPEPTVDKILQLEPVLVHESIYISGITLSNSGPNMVWINNQVYEDGHSMDNKMQIKILSEENIRVRITAPDKKYYFATSGETIDIYYRMSVKN